jgi:hypothetical protein
MIKLQSHRENGSGGGGRVVASGLRGSRMICATFAASMSTGAPWRRIRMKIQLAYRLHNLIA